MQTLLFHKFIKDVEWKIIFNNQGYPIAKTPILSADHPVCLDIAVAKVMQGMYVFTLYESDFSRKIICVNTETYPLIWLFWWLFYQLEVLNYKLQSLAFHVLKDWFNGGADFVPRHTLVGHWNSMIKHFIGYKLQKKCTQHK